MRIASSLLPVALLVAGCGSDAIPGAQPDMAVVPPDLSVPLDFTIPPDLTVLKDLSGPIDLSPPSDFGGVLCGNMTCGMGLKCCASVQNMMLTQTCQATCDGDAGNFLVACDGPEDCMGNPCCVKVSVGGGGMQMGGAAACENAPNACQINIAGGQFTTRLCHQNADCAGLNVPLLGPASCCHEASQPNVHLCAAPINFMGFNFVCP